jgi:wyosine [tRNA(Phe)-imidazoG37] synthetase (radical SAM superfamily)
MSRMNPSSLTSDVYTSRRFGRTLELNLFAGQQKICSLNCVHCSLGETTVRLNKVRRDIVFLSPAEILNGLAQSLSATSQFDSLVVAGNGEPTLHPEFVEISTGLHALLKQRNINAKTWLISNAAHFDSRRSIDAANLFAERLIRVDAGTEKIFKQINQPLARVTLSKIMPAAQSLQDCWISSVFFSGQFGNMAPGEIDEWLEVIGLLKPKGMFIQTMKHQSTAFGAQACNTDLLYGISTKVEKKMGIKPKVID